jgi:hypothetical protein
MECSRQVFRTRSSRKGRSAAPSPAPPPIYGLHGLCQEGIGFRAVAVDTYTELVVILVVWEVILFIVSAAGSSLENWKQRMCSSCGPLRTMLRLKFSVTVMTLRSAHLLASGVRNARRRVATVIASMYRWKRKCNINITTLLKFYIIQQ